MPRLLLRACATVVLTAPLCLAACGTDEPDGPTVVTSAYPMEFLTSRIAGDHYAVVNLTQPGQDSHELELSARQVASIQTADLLVYVEQFQAPVDEAVAQAGRDDGTTVDLATVVDLMESGHHEDDHEGHQHDEEGHEGHDHGNVDPHFWLDPQRMILAAEAIADALATVDDDHAEEYRDNAADLVADLEILDTEFRTGLAQCERASIVTSHEAFGYLTHAYGLTQIPIAGLEPNQEPSSAQLAEITDLVTNDGITTIFTEELADPKIAQTVAAATGATTATLDPIEGLSDATADEDYFSLMRANLDAIRKANACQ